MSLPIARARRKNVPSIQRSPYSSTLSQSRTESWKPSVVMSQASWSSPTSHSSLTSRISEMTRAKSSSRVASADDQLVDRVGHAAVHPGLAAAGQSRRELVDVAHRAGRATTSISWSDGRRPAQSSPYCGRGRTRRCRGTTAAGRRGRRRRPRPPARRRWSGCRRSRCARCRSGSGSRCRRTAPCSCRPGAPAARRGTSRRAWSGGPPPTRRPGWRGRSSSRSPQPWRMNAFQASGTTGSCVSVLGCAVSGVVCSVTSFTLRRAPVGKQVRRPCSG